MGAVEIGRSVATAQVGRVVAVVKEPQAALFIGCVGEGVGNSCLKAMAELLFQVGFKGMIGRDAGAV